MPWPSANSPPGVWSTPGQKQKKLEKNAKIAEAAAKEAQRAANAAKKAAAEHGKGGKQSGGKGAAEKPMQPAKGSGKGVGGSWACTYAECLKDLQKYAPGRGPYMNPASTTQCFHCWTHRGFAEKVLDSEKEASKAALREAAARQQSTTSTEPAQTSTAVAKDAAASKDGLVIGIITNQAAKQPKGES